MACIVVIVRDVRIRRISPTEESHMRRVSPKLACLLVLAFAAAAPDARAQGRDEKYTVTVAPDYLEVQPGAAIQFQAALFHRGERKFLPQAWEWACDGGAFA